MKVFEKIRSLVLPLTTFFSFPSTSSEVSFLLSGVFLSSMSQYWASSSGHLDSGCVLTLGPILDVGESHTITQLYDTKRHTPPCLAKTGRGVWSRWVKVCSYLALELGRYCLAKTGRGVWSHWVKIRSYLALELGRSLFS